MKHVITAVYVDLDGVLCDFKKRFFELYKDVPEIDYPSKTKEKSEYKKRFDDFILGGHFASLESMSDFETGLCFLESIEDLYTIKILSSSAKEKYIEEVSKQKEKWLTDWEIKYPVIIVPGKKLKQYYACPLGLLIDDTLSNVEEWRERGGKAILHRSWKHTIEEFEDNYE